MRLLAMVTEPASVARYLATTGEDRGAAPLARPRAAVLEEPRPSPPDPRRRGRVRQPRREGRRHGVPPGAEECGGGRGVERSARLGGMGAPGGLPVPDREPLPERDRRAKRPEGPASTRAGARVVGRTGLV